GFDSFEELWEAGFEQELGHGSPDGYLDVLGDFGAKARELGDTVRHPVDARREACMAAAARELVESGLAPEAIVLVCGAAHAAAVAHAFWDGAKDGDGPIAQPGVEPGAPTEIALIPYSFPRLSEQSGYGAGNRAPWYYQQVWERGGDYLGATRHSL